MRLFGFTEQHGLYNAEYYSGRRVRQFDTRPWPWYEEVRFDGLTENQEFLFDDGGRGSSRYTVWEISSSYFLGPS